MADVSINYKGSKIAELAERGNKTLKTSGKYCEGDIEVNYTPNSRTYELTLSKASGWVLLTALDADVLEHINDDSFSACFSFVGEYEYVNYAMPFMIAKNTSFASQSVHPVYGMALRQSNETTTTLYPIYYPANKTDTTTALGGAQFRVSKGNYYIRPSDGFVRAGTHKLTFTW